MRAKRVRAIVAGAVVTASERRKLKRQHNLARRARAGSSPEPKGIPGKHVFTAWPQPAKAHHPTRAISRFWKRLSETGKARASNLILGPERTGGSLASRMARPRMFGHGAASWLSKPELARRIEDLKKYMDLKSYVEVR